MPWSVTTAPVCTFTRMKRAPTAVAMARAETASERRALMPRGRETAPRISVATAAMAATQAGSTRPGEKRASHLFHRAGPSRAARQGLQMHHADDGFRRREDGFEAHEAGRKGWKG